MSKRFRELWFLSPGRGHLPKNFPFFPHLLGSPPFHLIGTSWSAPMMRPSLFGTAFPATIPASGDYFQHFPERREPPDFWRMKVDFPSRRLPDIGNPFYWTHSQMSLQVVGKSFFFFFLPPRQEHELSGISIVQPPQKYFFRRKISDSYLIP